MMDSRDKTVNTDDFIMESTKIDEISQSIRNPKCGHLSEEGSDKKPTTMKEGASGDLSEFN